VYALWWSPRFPCTDRKQYKGRTSPWNLPW
jgi:hypothetical protein